MCVIIIIIIIIIEIRCLCVDLSVKDGDDASGEKEGKQSLERCVNMIGVWIDPLAGILIFHSTLALLSGML